MAKSTLKSFKNTVWKSCAAYIKLRDADSNGMVACCTCNRIMSIYDQICNAGHFIPTRNNTVLFDDHLIHSQCSDCNCGGSGEQYRYGLFMAKKYGHSEEVLEEMQSLRHRVKKITMADLKEIKKRFDDEIIRLTYEKGLTCPGAKKRNENT